MGFQGSLDSASFADIVNKLCRTNQEGVLTVFDDKRKKAIYFRNNGVTLIGGNQRMKLGDLLLHADKIAPKELDRALSEQKRTGKLLGEIVVEQGLVTSEEIEDLIADQIEEEICDIFFWENAQFMFQEGPPQEEDTSEFMQVSLIFDVRRLLFRIADKIGEWESIRKQIPSFSVIFVTTKSTLDLDLTNHPDSPQHFAQVIPHLSGANDVNDIIRLSQLPVLSVCRILLILLENNAIRQATYDELMVLALEMQQKNKTQKQIHVLEQALLLRPNDEELLLKIAHAYENTGGSKKTAEYYCKLADRIFVSDPKNAAKHFERAIAHSPNSFEPREKVLQLYDLLNDTDKELYHSNMLGNLYLQEGIYEKAQLIGIQYSEKFPEAMEFHSILAKAYACLGQVNLAVQEYEIIAANFEHLNNLENYIATLEKAIDLDPKRLDIQRQILRTKRFLKWRKHRKAILLSVGIGVILIVLLGAVTYYELAARNLYSNAQKFENTNDEIAQKLYEELLDKYPRSTVAENAEESLLALKQRLNQMQQLEDAQFREREKTRLKQFEHIKNLAQLGRFQEAKSYLVGYKREYREEKWQKICEDTEKFIVYWEQQMAKKDAEIKLKKAKEYQKAGQLDEAIQLYEELRGGEFQEVVANELKNIYNSKLLLLIKVTKEKFDQGLAQERGGNFKAALALYYEIEKLAREALEIKSISNEQGIDISHTRQLAENGRLRIEEWDRTAMLQIKEAQVLEQQGKISEAYQTILGILADPKLGKTEAASKASLPIQLDTEPSGARVREFSCKTPAIIHIDPKKVQKIEVSYPGFMTELVTLSAATPFSYKINLTKRILWQYDSAGPIWGRIFTYRDWVVITSRSGKIAALNAKDGKSLWEYSTRRGIGDVEAGATISNGKAYVGSNDKYLYALDLETGKPDWEFLSDGFIKMSPAVEQETIFFGTMGGSFYALAQQTGKKLWQYSSQDAHFKTSPIIWSNLVIAGNTRGELLAFHLLDGRLVWNHKLEPMNADFVLGDKSLFFGTSLGHLYCWDIEQNVLVWKTKLQGRSDSRVTLAANLVYGVTTNGYVFCLQRNSGKIQWQKKIANALYSAPAFLDELLYVGAMDKRLYMLDKKGEIFWQGILGDKGIRSDITFNDSTIFIGTEEGILYALPRS